LEPLSKGEECGWMILDPFIKRHVHMVNVLFFKTGKNFNFGWIIFQKILLMKLTTGETQWIEGPSLPKPIYEAQLVQHPFGGVVLIGGYDGREQLNSLYKLSTLNDNWELLPQKLKTARREHTAFLIDDELTTCSLKL